MKYWTVHVRDGRPPVLVPERFSLAAMLFGPLWLAAQRAWIAAVLVLCGHGLILVLSDAPWQPILALALAWLVGLSGHDLRRWALARRRFRLAHVVAAGDEDAALLRLFDRQPSLAAVELVAGRTV